MEFDEAIQEALVRVVSTVLPHQNYNPDYFQEIMKEVTSIVPLEEMYMQYYVMFSILVSYSKLRVLSKEVRLDKETFERIIEARIASEATKEEIRLRDYLIRNGLGSDFRQEEDKTIAMQELYRLCVELYDEAFELEIPSELYHNEVKVLREVYFSFRAAEITNVSREILQNGYKSRGFGKEQTGVEDFLSYSIKELTDLNSRLKSSSEENSVIVLDDEAKGMELIRISNESSIPLAEYGIPELDDATPMLSHRFVIIAANPGVGKTTMMVSLVVRMMLAGKVCAIFSGENAAHQVYTKVLSSWIRAKYGVYFPEAVINDTSRIGEEEKKLLMSYNNELAKSGLLVLKDAFDYSTFTEDMKALESYGVEGIFIDHSLSMKNMIRDNPTATLDQLARDIRAYKRESGAFVCLLSHLSADAKRELSQGTNLVGAVTRYSSELQAEADDVFVLNTSPTLRERSQIQLLVAKRRGPSVTNSIILDFDFPYLHYEYNEESQTMSAGQVSKDNALDALTELYGGDGEDEFFSDLGIDF